MQPLRTLYTNGTMDRSWVVLHQSQNGTTEIPTMYLMGVTDGSVLLVYSGSMRTLGASTV